MENKEKAELNKRQEEIQGKAFKMMIEILFVFGLPAVLALIVGFRLDDYFETGKLVTIGLLAFAFIMSWVVVIFMYKRIDKELKQIESLKSELNKRERE